MGLLNYNKTVTRLNKNYLMDWFLNILRTNMVTKPIYTQTHNNVRVKIAKTYIYYYYVHAVFSQVFKVFKWAGH